MDASERLLAELIALPSVNPAFLPIDHPHAGERRVGEYLLAQASMHGLDVALQEVAPGRYNYLARLGPTSSPSRTIILAPHLDTVNATPEQLKPVKKNGRLYGRGACDTKGSVAAMFLALCDLAESPRRPKDLEVIFAGLADEENGQLGSRGYAANGRKADLAIIGEPTELKVITAHKGNLWLKFRTKGRSAHGARPDLGKNAVLEMARIVQWLEEEHSQALRRRKHALLGVPTVNVGRIAGGTQANIVPDECEIMLDRRTLPGESDRAVLRELKAGLAARRLSATIESAKGGPCLPLQTDVANPLVHRFLKSMNCRPQGAHYFCDASIFASAGTPSLVFGPGNIAQAHTVEEFIAVAEVEQARRKLVRFLESLG
jgi:acetylornithine deacetylase/succinyl-diaminopimelate desuccinylase-like protein